MSAKRKRTTNYAADEKNLLLSIVHKYKYIVYNQKTENRKNSEEERAKSYNTGGGPKKNIPTNDLLISIVNEKTVEGFNNPFNGDQLASSSNEGTSVTPPTVDLDATFLADLNHQDIEIICEADIADPSWQHYKPADLQKPTAQPLVVTVNNSEGESNKKHKYDARRRPALSFVANSHISEKYNTLLDHRILLTEQEVQKRKREEEEWTFLTKKHKLEIENLEADLKKNNWK